MPLGPLSSQKPTRTMTTTNLTPGSLSTVFSDIEPTLQEEASPVASIAYTADFVTAFDYLRTCLRTDERSDRTLALTGLCLRLNPANYTVWHYRRRILATLQRKSDCDSAAGEEKLPVLDADVLKSELQLASSLGGANPKNYQVWYHRRALLEPILNCDSTEANEESAVSTAKDELEYISTVLSNDGKNYHAWSFRQHILRTLSNTELWESDLAYTDTLIAEDVRNNSAWNHRWFVCHRGTRVPCAPDAAAQECDYALTKAEIDPHNESPWIYLLGYIKEQVRSEADGNSDLVARMVQESKRLRETVADTTCACCDSTRIELLDMVGGEEARNEAAALANQLGTVDDTIRAKFWARREGQLKAAQC